MGKGSKKGKVRKNIGDKGKGCKDKRGGGKCKGPLVGKPTGGSRVGLLQEWQQPSQWRGGWDNYKGGPARNDLVF